MTVDQRAPDPTSPEPTAAPSRGPRRRWFLPAYTGLVITFLFIPIIVMVLFGFNDYQGRFNYTWQGFTLKWYKNLFAFPELTEALRNSLIIAGVSTLAATILGTLIALALRHRFRGRSGLNMFIFLPMATPEIVLGVSLLSLFVTVQFARGFLTIIIAHIMFCISYVVVTVKARTASMDHNLEDAAQDLGATPWSTFWTVTFPLILPGIIAAGALAAVLSIDDYVITRFVAGPVTTLPLWIYGASRIGVPAQVNVIGSLLLLIGIIYTVVTLWRSRRAAS